jgi:periplasmic protein TonB
MDVTDILRDRMQEPDGLRKMVSVSLLLHGALIAGLLFAPRGFLTKAADAPRAIMTITLSGGGTGPSSGGMTSIGGRPVQVQTPPEEVARREAVRPPAAKAPEMTVPLPGAKPVRPSAASVKAPDDARGRTPTRGAEERPGNAVVETGARGLGFGLSSGGGPGSGSTLDVSGDFCCPDYVGLMVETIRRSWNQQAEIAGSVLIKFTIERDGKITQMSLEKTSGHFQLDTAAQTAVAITGKLPPLPAQYTNSTLTVHLNFQYQR